MLFLYRSNESAFFWKMTEQIGLFFWGVGVTLVVEVFAVTECEGGSGFVLPEEILNDEACVLVLFGFEGDDVDGCAACGFAFKVAFAGRIMNRPGFVTVEAVKNFHVRVGDADVFECRGFSKL